jgi:hypothetical protein
MSTAPRRFPAPWSVRELEQAFAARGGNGQAVAYTYFRRDENEARQARVLTRNEARRIAANIARLPELLSRARPARESLSKPHPGSQANMRPSVPPPSRIPVGPSAQ